MQPPDSKAPGKTAGLGMLAVSFALGLLLLTLFFDGWLDRQWNPNRNPDSREPAAGVREVSLKRNRNGHYLAGGSINGIPVTFLLDTGATDVAIPQEVAGSAGLDRGYPSRALTANGAVTVYATTVDELMLGNITLHNVTASITPSMVGNTILLGMSALGEVEFSQRDDVLTLRHYAFD